MDFKQNLQNNLLIYIIFSAVFFVTGSTVCYIISENSLLYIGLKESLCSNLSSTSPLSISVLCSAFFNELRYIFFTLIATFTTYKRKLFPLLISYKSLLLGGCCSCLLREIRGDTLNADGAIFGCFVFVLMSVAIICVLCLLCTISHIYSERLIYPPKLNVILKRKDTYLFLFDFLACCGMVFILILIKQASLYIMLY